MASKIPTTEQLLALQESIKATQRDWLDRCRELAELRVPESLFKRLPEGLWRVMPWGHRLVMLHAPPVNRAGSIHLPTGAQTRTDYGWVLSVGEMICTPTSTATNVCPYPEPLALVGEFVSINKLNARLLPLSFNYIKRADAEDIQIAMTHVGEIYFPLTEVHVDDWTAEQPSNLLLTGVDTQH